MTSLYDFTRLPLQEQIELLEEVARRANEDQRKLVQDSMIPKSLETILEESNDLVRRRVMDWVNRWNVKYGIHSPGHHGVDWTVDVDDVCKQVDVEAILKEALTSYALWVIENLEENIKNVCQQKKDFLKQQ